MIILRSRKSSIIGGAIIFVLLLPVRTACLAQEARPDASDSYFQTYNATQEALSPDPLIQNGIYYTYPYYNAVGHPFLEQKEFVAGSVYFRGKQYVGFSINYDVFNQQIILSWESDGMLQMCLLAPQFVDGFELQGKRFVKAEFQEASGEFFQLISDNTRLSCYYSWYKERREVRDSGNRSIFNFSEQKRRHYLLLDGQFHRYKNNKSFLKLFPEDSRDFLKSYLNENSVQVMNASDQAMDNFIDYCNGILDQLANQGGV